MPQDSMLVPTHSTQEALALTDPVNGTFTTTIRAICDMLSVTRPWVHQFIRPFVRYVYIPRDISAIPKYNRHDNVYINSRDFDYYIASHLVFTRQTIRISIDELVDPEDGMEAFTLRYDKLIKAKAKAKEENDTREMRRCRDALRILILSTLSPDGQLVWEDLPTKMRSQTPHVPCPAPFDINDQKITSAIIRNMNSIAGKTSYGGNTECAYRYLYNNGGIRCQLVLPDENGVCSSKVFYFTEPIPPRAVNVKYSAYLQHICKQLAPDTDF